MKRSSTTITNNHDEGTVMFHPKEWMLVMVLLLVVGVVRIWITSSVRAQMDVFQQLPLRYEIKHPDDLAHALAQNCRLDVEALCRIPPFYHPDQSLTKNDNRQRLPNSGEDKEPFTLVLLRDDITCETESLVPNPILSINSPRSFQSCPWKTAHRLEDSPQVEKEQLFMIIQKLFDVSILRLRYHHLLTDNRKIGSRNQALSFTSQGMPWIGSSYLLANSEAQTRIIRGYLHYLFKYLVKTNETDEALDHAKHENGSLTSDILMAMPHEVMIPRQSLTLNDALDMLNESVNRFADEYGTPGDVNFLGLLRKVVKEQLPHTPNPSNILGRLPSLPFDYGEQMSECLRDLHNQDSLLSASCHMTAEMAADKRLELEFWLDFPIAWTIKWLYLALAIVSLTLLGQPLGEGETKLQRVKRQFMQTMKDPLLRRGIEQQAIKDLGEEKAAEFMAGLDKRVADYEGEIDADEAWQKQEAMMVAWRDRLIFLKKLRALLGLFVFISLALLYFDSPQAGQLVDSIAILLGAFGCSYCYLPQSPRQTTKRSEAEEPLLSNVSTV